MGRPITSIMIIDNSPHSYAFNPENAVPCESWFDDMNDTELFELIPILQEIAKVDNVISELEARKMNGYSALMGLNNSESEDHSSEYYSTTSSQSATDSSSWVSTSQTDSRTQSTTGSNTRTTSSYTTSSSASSSGSSTGSSLQSSEESS